MASMSTTRRAYDILRGYVNNEWERLRGIEETDAEKELAASMEPGYRSPQPPAEGTVHATSLGNSKEQARKVLGVGPNDSFVEVRKAFEKLNQRSNPANFPEGSAEQRQASDIQRRVQWAYSVLSEGVDLTEKRFGSLEID